MMRIGKTFSKEMNSGLGKSGDVHVRIYSPSASSKLAFARGVASSSSSSPTGSMIGLGGSSILSAGASVDTGAWLVRLEGRYGVAEAGLSVNGSLGARGRLE